MSKWWYAAPLIGSLLGCPKPPTPTPSPTPTPTPVVDTRPAEPVYLDYLLRQEGGKFTMGGKPYDLVGAIPCWPTDGTGEQLYVDGKLIPYWWSLVSPEWIDHVKTKGANAVHVRLGPTIDDDACCGMEEVGGPYTYDNFQWNEGYWARLHKVLHHAGRAGFTVEVDVLDGWVVKHAAWGDVTMPWPSDDVAKAYVLPMNPSVKKWFDKVIFETCNYANVVYEIGNENDLAPNWTSEYEREAHRVIRALEQSAGCANVVHMIGSNTSDWGGPYDYFASHDPSATLKPVGGRPLEVNEYNPHLSPQSFHTRLCEARATGQSFWYWRSDGSDAIQDESLNLIKVPCGGTPACYLVPGDRLTGMTSTTTVELNAAKAAVGDVCGKPPDESLQRLAVQLNAQGSCAVKDEDRVFIKRTDGNIDEQRAVAYTDGCWTNKPYLNTFSGGGGGGCSNPVAAPVSEFASHWNGSWYDGTPLRTSDCAYCTSIGMGEINGTPRCSCPIRNECPDTPGYEGKCEQRVACERVAMGGLATWQGDGTVEVNMSNENHLQARCSNCTWLKVCNTDGSVCSGVTLQ